MLRRVWFCLCLLVAAPVAAQSPWGSPDRGLLFDLSEGSVVMGHALDLAATVDCRATRRCQEANPWLARYERPIPFTLAKFGVAGLGLWATRKLHARHPRLATLANYTIGAGFSALAIRNTRIGQCC